MKRLLLLTTIIICTMPGCSWFGKFKRTDVALEIRSELELYLEPAEATPPIGTVELNDKSIPRLQT